MLVESGDEELEELLFDDLVRFETALTLLRPLAEGLATFAEFDAIPKIRSQTVSNVMRWASVLYMDPAEVAADMSRLPAQFAIDAGLSQALARLRRDVTTLNRKSSVLLRPFAAADAYLVGYLTVKSLWRSVARNCFRIANETDLFLMYSIGFFYCDLEFVRVLLDRDSRGRKAASAIVNYIARRFDQLLQMTEADIDAYEQAALKEEPMVGIGVSVADAAKGQSALDQLLKDLISSDDKSFPFYAGKVVARRQFMNLGSLDGEVTVSGSGVVELRAGDVVLYAAQAQRQVAPGSSPGTLELIFSMQGRSISRAIVVSRGDEMVSCDIIGPQSQADVTRRAVEITFNRREAALKLERMFTEALTSLMDGRWMAYDLQHIREQTVPMFDDLYKDIALRFARDYDAIDAVATLMRDGGMRPLLKTSDLVKGVAFLGMACSLNPNDKALAREFKTLGLSLGDTLNGLERAYHEYGFPPPLLVAGDTIFSTI
jgi:hypothetical protein